MGLALMFCCIMRGCVTLDIVNICFFIKEFIAEMYLVFLFVRVEFYFGLLLFVISIICSRI
jgi:hypothetical protein